MKRFLVLFLILIMMLLLYACGQKETGQLSEASGVSGTSSAKTETGNPGKQTDYNTDSQVKQKGAVTIKTMPPNGWTPVEGSVIPVQYMKGTASFMVKSEPFRNATLDDVVNEALGIFRKSFDNLSVQGEVQPLTIDGKDARKLVFTCTVGKMNMKFLYVYLFVADKTYAITFGDLESTFDSLSADYETILSNIRFTEQ